MNWGSVLRRLKDHRLSNVLKPYPSPPFFQGWGIISTGLLQKRRAKVQSFLKEKLFKLPSCEKEGVWTTYLLSLFFLLLILSISTTTANAASSSHSTTQLIEYLTQEKTNLTLVSNEGKRLASVQPLDQKSLTRRQEQNKAMIALIGVKITSLESFLSHQRRQQQILSNRLKNLQQSSLEQSEGPAAFHQISKINTSIAVNHRAIELICDNLSLLRHYQGSLLYEHRQLDIWQAKINEQHQLDELNLRINALDDASNTLYHKNLAIQQSKQVQETFNNRLNTEATLLMNNQAIILIQYRITELELQKKLIKSEHSLIINHDVKTLQSVTETYKNAIDQLSSMVPSLNKMVEMLKSEQSLVQSNHLKQQCNAIQKTASLRLEQIISQQKLLQVSLGKKQRQLKKLLSIRQSLVEYHLDSWPSIGNQLLLIPIKFYNYVKTLLVKAVENYLRLDLWSMVFYWASMVFILVAAVVFNRLLRIVIQDKERSRLSAHLYDGLLIILYRNVPHIAVLSLIIMTFFLNNILLVNYQLLVNLLLVWLMFRNLILIARLVLLERVSDSSGQDVRLYYRLKWLMLVGGWTTALMLFSQQLPLPILLQDIFSRLFMLFILAVSGVAWKSKDVIPALLQPVLITKKRYFQNAISLLTVLLPLILLTTAIIGLVGYINLAWTLSRYQAYLVLLMTAYILMRGLVFDLLEFLSEWMISSLQNGWLWIEVILKPLDKILRVLLILLSIIISFQLIGLYADATLMANLQRFGNYAFIDISGAHITLVSILEFILLLCLFIWISKWTREFSYRWMYRHASDVGIRNSLSVFTQYAVILLGVFITLRVLGLDFSGMSMVLGGLAVGMGFGLRDFASNIVGGIMLLIERPVREGDLITLGEYEGRVAHIGIRSMRVSSWDNMEVLIPNAETFNKPFTNWTHQDNVVRTVVPIKVSRADDPLLIQQLMLDVLAIIPEILSEPAPQVFLKQIDDALIDFEVRYFINVQLYTRFEIRSKVLFAIMSQFKAAGIKAPIPPLSVELIEGHHASSPNSLND